MIGLKLLLKPNHISYHFKLNNSRSPVRSYEADGALEDEAPALWQRLDSEGPGLAQGFVENYADGGRQI
jgi:hypothetical protein